MATKARESSVGGKEKKAPSSSSNSSSTTTKKPTKLSERPSSNPEKQIPNYLRSTISSRVESQSVKLPKTGTVSTETAATTITNKPVVNRRRSFDKPISASGVQKQKQPSPSRQHKALVSPGPRERKTIVKSAVGPVKSIIRSQSISEKTSSKTVKDGKTQPVVATKGLKKSVSSCCSSSTAKKATKDDAKSAPAAEGTEKLSNSVESEPEVKEAIEEEVVKLESKENGGDENVVSEAEHEHDHDEDENEEKTEEADQGQVQGDEEDEKVIPTVSEEQEQEQEEVAQVEDGKNKTEQEESSNNANNESTTEEAEEEEEEEEEAGVKEKKEETEQGGVIAEAEQQKSGEVNGNNKEEEEKEEVQSEQAEKVESEVKEEAKEESNNKGKQGSGVVMMMHGKKTAQVSNGVIEETASKLLQEERRNKVRALAGAFQSVIDYQTK